MLENFRRMIRGWLGKVLIALFALPFALFGVSSIFESGGQNDYVAKVEGVEISKYELDRAIELRRQSIKQRFGENIPDTMLDAEFLKPSVLEGLIERQLLIKSAEDHNLQYSMEEIKLLIAKETAFHEDGKFSQERYQQILSRAGILPQTYPDEFRNDLISTQLRDGYASTSFVTPKELLVFKNLTDQTRDIKYITIDPALVKNKVNIDETEIDNYYQTHQAEFEIAEQVSIEYIELLKDQYVEKESVSETEVQQRFEDKISLLKEQQERKSSHILVTIDDERNEKEAKLKIDDLYTKIQAGEDFAKLAKEHSDDAGSAEKGGDLGFAGKGIYAPEFEKTLFSLSTGEISKPVLTEFGYHIIKYVESAPELPKLEDIKDTIINEIALDKAEQPYIDTLEELANIAYESADLIEPSEFLKKDPQVSSFISRSGGEGLLANKDIIKAAFSDEVLKQGLNSDVLELDEGHAIVLRLKEHKPASVKPLAEVSELVREKVLNEKAKQTVQSLGQAIVDSKNTGDDIGEQLNQYDLEWESVKSLKRNSPEISREISAQAFRMPKPDPDKKEQVIIDGFQLANGSYAVLQILEVNQPDQELKDEERLQLAKVIENQKGVNEFQNYIAWLRETSDVEIR